jgi:probable rRNA maturation factor
MPSKATVSDIRFHSIDRNLPLRERTRLKNFLITLFKNEKTLFKSLTYVFCSDNYLLRINRDFLQHDFYTDIITFNLSNDRREIVGEIYISLDRVIENAYNLNLPLKQELHRVIFHGALHLCGYKDKSKKDLLLMRKLEDKYLSEYF